MSTDRVAEDGMAADPVFAMHEGGKLAVASTVPLRDEDDLSMAYTPGVARVCTAIAEDPSRRHARVVATGRSDFPNQINNVLAFPGVFKGAFDAHAAAITEGMKLAAAEALDAVVGDDVSADYVVPSPFDDRVVPAVAAAVSRAARADGAARR